MNNFYFILILFYSCFINSFYHGLVQNNISTVYSGSINCFTFLPDCLIYYRKSKHIFCPRNNNSIDIEKIINLFTNLSINNHDDICQFKLCSCIPVLFQNCFYLMLHQKLQDKITPQNREIFYNYYVNNTYMITKIYTDQNINDVVIEQCLCGKKCQKCYSRYSSQNLINFSLRVINNIDRYPEFNENVDKLFLLEHICFNDKTLYKKCDKCIIVDDYYDVYPEFYETEIYEPIDMEFDSDTDDCIDFFEDVPKPINQYKNIDYFKEKEMIKIDNLIKQKNITNISDILSLDIDDEENKILYYKLMDIFKSDDIFIPNEFELGYEDDEIDYNSLQIQLEEFTKTNPGFYHFIKKTDYG